MPYQNISAGSFAHSVEELRLAYPGVCIPEGVSYQEFQWYRPAIPPVGHALQHAAELPPVGGIQQWRLSELDTPELCSWLKRELAREYESRMEVIAADYPPSERESWPVQIEEAAAIMEDASAITPWIDAASAARGIGRVELAARILGKDRAYRVISGTLSGARQKIEDAIDVAATDVPALLSIDITSGWPSSGPV